MVPCVRRTVQEVWGMLGEHYSARVSHAIQIVLKVAFNLGTEDNCRSSEGAPIFAKGWVDLEEG